MTNDFFPHIYILIRSWRGEKFLEGCLRSALEQDYPHFTILFCDDNSGYNHEQKIRIKKILKGHVCVFNTIRKFSLRNAYEMLKKYGKKKDAIVVNLDGDDRLTSKNALSIIAKTYKNTGCALTYGECYITSRWFGLSQFIPSRFVLNGLNTRYPKFVEKDRSYRRYRFLPLHPRSWKLSLFRSINTNDFLNTQGEWYKTCEDQAMFFPMLEMAGKNYIVIQKPIYLYRENYCLSDSTLNRKQQIIDEYSIRNKKKYPLFRNEEKK